MCGHKGGSKGGDYCAVCGSGKDVSRCVRCGSIFCQRHSCARVTGPDGYGWAVDPVVCQACTPQAQAEIDELVGQYPLLQVGLLRWSRPMTMTAEEFWVGVVSLLESLEDPPLQKVQLLHNSSYTFRGWKVWPSGDERDRGGYYCADDRRYRDEPWSQDEHQWRASGVAVPAYMMSFKIESLALAGLRARLGQTLRP